MQCPWWCRPCATTLAPHSARSLLPAGPWPTWQPLLRSASGRHWGPSLALSGKRASQWYSIWRPAARCGCWAARYLSLLVVVLLLLLLALELLVGVVLLLLPFHTFPPMPLPALSACAALLPASCTQVGFWRRAQRTGQWAPQWPFQW